MDADKMKKWLDMAKQFSGNDFWTDIFGQSGVQSLLEGHPLYQNKSEAGSGTQPIRVDVFRTEREIIVAADLPGVSKEHLQLATAENTLFIKGTAPPLITGAEVVTSERLRGDFERAVQLPVKTIRVEEIRATFQNGILEVRIPRHHQNKKNIPIT